MTVLRYQSGLDPELFADAPNTPEGLADLQSRVSAAQQANPDDPRYFIGSVVEVDKPDSEE